MEINGKVTAKDMFKLVNNLHDIPKSAFIKAMFCFIMQDDYEIVIEMMNILENLQKYGPLAYFFSPYDFPLLVYSVFHMATKVTGDFFID